MSDDTYKKDSERRQYLRLESAFPIEFQLVDPNDRTAVSDLKEGFTRNVGKGGMGIFAKTLKDQDKKTFGFIPGKTKLKLNINIPLDSDPIESFATVEWLEKSPGPIVDTYSFGVSYDFINEIDYDRIMKYVKWLQMKPKIIFLALVLLSAGFIFTSAFLYKENMRRQKSENQLKETIVEEKLAKAARARAERRAEGFETDLDSLARRQMAIQAAFLKLVEEKKALEKITELSEETRQDLEEQVEEMAREREVLEAEIEEAELQATEVEEYYEESEEVDTKKISKERLNAEDANYVKFRELILNEKIQSLSVYVSTHRSSIYHAAALFALAELRYKNEDRALAEVNYNQIIEFYPKSIYALYASHRLDQLRSNYMYDYYSLQDFYQDYNISEFFDYREIAPYVR